MKREQRSKRCYEYAYSKIIQIMKGVFSRVHIVGTYPTKTSNTRGCIPNYDLGVSRYIPNYDTGVPGYTPDYDTGVPRNMFDHDLVVPG